MRIDGSDRSVGGTGALAAVSGLVVAVALMGGVAADADVSADVTQEASEQGEEAGTRGLLSPAEGESLEEWTIRWMDGPVQHVATDEEKRLFERLDTTQQRLEFIRLFWQRRDPRLRGPDNEFLAEFERRVAYAVDHFTVGDRPGWDTVFGRVVLAYGPPDRVRRELGGFPDGFSDRPPILWTYDKRLPELSPNEDLLFVFRNGRWRLLPPSPIGESTFDAQRRALERDSALTPEISSDYQRSMATAVRDSLVNEVDYDAALDRVEATVAFADAQIPFGWEADFRPAADGTQVDLRLTFRMSALIFHRVDEVYRTDMLVRARLRDGDEVVAETSETIRVEVDADELARRQEELVEESVTLTVPPGTYSLELELEDRVLGYRTAYREELEVPAVRS